LIKSGAIERISRELILSGKFYEFIGKKGVYTRKRGLDRETNNQRLLKNIRDNAKKGSKFGELREVLHSLSRDQVQKLLGEMKKQSMITVDSTTRVARWHDRFNVKIERSDTLILGIRCRMLATAL